MPISSNFIASCLFLMLGAMSGCTMTPVTPTSPWHCEAFPPAKIETTSIGQSIEDRPIDCIRFPGTRPGPPVLIFAGIHGDEPTTVAVARRLVDLLTATPDPARPTVLVIPLANPDGYERRTRVNARQVDLNRNFPAANFHSKTGGRNASGPEPLCEPESRALHDLVERKRPARILALHSIRPPRHGNNFDGPAESLARLLASHNGYAVLPTMGYATPGSFGSWAGVDRQIPTITLELPSNAPAERAWAENRDALLAFIRGQ